MSTNTDNNIEYVEAETMHGELVIQTIHGQYGEFNTARFRCTLGEFVIRNEILAQFEQGIYIGSVDTTAITIGHYQPVPGRIIAELRMTVIDMDMEKKGSKPKPVVDNVEVETDAAETVVDETETETKSVDVPDIDIALKEVELPEENSEGKVPASAITEDNLFNGIDMSGDFVKLDPTVGREYFRTQKDELKARGYKFNPKEQSWFLPSDAS